MENKCSENLTFLKNQFFLIVFLYVVFSNSIFSQTSEPFFEHLIIEDGLSDMFLMSITQDYLGYMWFGTGRGLIRYDGYSMKLFNDVETNPDSLSSQYIRALYEDRLKNLWIGTNRGLNKFIRESESFVRFRHDPKDSNSVDYDYISSIYEDSAGRLWVGTLKGLNLFDMVSKKFIRYKFPTQIDNDPNLTGNQFRDICINAIIEDPISGNLLIGADIQGLLVFDVKQKQFSKYRFKDGNNDYKKVDNIQSFCQSKDGNIWMTTNNFLLKLNPDSSTINIIYQNSPLSDYLGIKSSHPKISSVIQDKDENIIFGFFTSDRGLKCFNPFTKVLNEYSYNPNIPNSISSNSIPVVYEDKFGIIWLGPSNRGIDKWNKHKNRFKRILNEWQNPNSLSDSNVYEIIADQKEYLWFCSAKSLDRYEIKSGKITHYLKDKSFIIYTARLAHNGYIWIGTFKSGLIRFDPLNNQYQRYFNHPMDSFNLINKIINCLLEDRNGNLWIGTNDYGLYKYNIRTREVKMYKNNPSDSMDVHKKGLYNPGSISSDKITCLYEDKFGNLWIGTYNNGLNVYNPTNDNFSHYWTGSTIIDIFEDSNSNLWVASSHYGLRLFDREKRQYTHSYLETDGISNGRITIIVEDGQKNLWLGTVNGLSKFDLKTKKFSNYLKKDGLISNMFNGTGVKASNGNLFFGLTNNGITFFDPKEIVVDSIPPKVIIENISLFNRPDEKIAYNGFISELKEMILSYNQNDLQFQYAGVHYGEPNMNKYKYILEGFDKKWVEAGTQRIVTYTNLNPGEYVFRVKAANIDGVWNETGATIKIIINPPLWATTWAYLFYLILFGSLLYYIWKMQLKRVRVKHEFEMSKFEAQKLHEVDEMKSRFFTNISHEFRTPLTLILGPVKQIIERTKEEKTKDDLTVVHKNANRLLGLVNQLLDISKIESGNMKLQTISINIIPYLKALVLSFTSYAERKRIALQFLSEMDELTVYIDKDKFEKIINNILSNALKFTPEGKKINVDVNRDENYLNISITDTGKGIAEEKLSKIFDRFYQVDGSHTREHEGTGIGLALTKELVELHKGKIRVESNENVGTKFIISLPLGNDYLKPEEIIEEDIKEAGEVPQKVNKIILELNEKEKLAYGNAIWDSDKPLLLIVEDNSDVRKYIIDYLENDYRIVEAFDGEDGLEKAINHMPDLIISDVMMPRMDGFELCNKIKNDERTSHIPIIMLTAKATSKDKIDGYKIGADDYIMKPFEAAELIVRIKNLIDIRRKLHEKFSSEDYKIPKELSSIDEQFMKRLLKIINEHLSEEEFSIEELGKESAMSRGQIYKKVKALTGKSPSLFLRSIRLSKAKKMIKDRRGTISEIAYSVGFNSPSYFTKCFNEEFGYPPSEIN